MGAIKRQQLAEGEPFKRPHVVVLGAGASMAAAPVDKDGRALPNMASLARTTGVEHLFTDAGVHGAETDFEAAYSRLRAGGEHEQIADEVDNQVRRYFGTLQIGEETTIYDRLLLGLRDKDLVASFNWDPLIVQSEERLRLMGIHSLPRVVFLHGNVAIGVCLEHSTAGMAGGVCEVCGQRLEPSPLLYPVTEKDYESNGFIRHAWEMLSLHLKHASLLTIFGYRAPETDVAAIAQFKEAWGTPEQRQFERLEFIIRPGADPDVTRDRWDDFVHTHHYDVFDDFHKSWIANHPRRTGEAFREQNLHGNFVETNPVPIDDDLASTVDWYRQLMCHEVQET